MQDKPSLRVTKDYQIFEMHEHNRDLHIDKQLEESMRKHGFMPSSAIHCKRNGDGKLKIIRGHHRFECARILGLPVWYIVDESNLDLFDLEGCARQNWNNDDFAAARARSGNPHYRTLIEFKRKHRLAIGAASSLVGGIGADSDSRSRRLRAGTFEVGDMTMANMVVRITDACREAGIPFATSSAFCGALCRIFHVPEFDISVLLHRIRLYPGLMRKRGNTTEYVEEVDALYNYGAKGKRIPLAFRAKEIGRQRQADFGGKRAEGRRLGNIARSKKAHQEG